MKHTSTEAHPQMYAVGADESDEEGGHEAEHESCVHEGHRHRQNPRPEAGLQQVDQSLRITAMFHRVSKLVISLALSLVSPPQMKQSINQTH